MVAAQRHFLSKVIQRAAGHAGTELAAGDRASGRIGQCCHAAKAHEAPKATPPDRMEQVVFEMPCGGAKELLNRRFNTGGE